MMGLFDSLPPRLKRYIDETFSSVQGWCHPHVFLALQPLVEEIDAGSSVARGPIAEIGVFHGKFFIGLMKMRPTMSGHHAFDVFDLQQFNLDYAGCGNLDALKSNITAAGEDLSQVEFIRGDSMAIKEADIARIRSKIGDFALFSIDGCHLAEHTTNDFRLAMAMTMPEGIILADDYYNPSWPGVHEGLARVFILDQPRFVPLCYITNKLLLCHISHHAKYLRILTEHFSRWLPSLSVKAVKRYGYDSLTIG